MSNRVLVYRVGTQPDMKAVVFWTSPRVTAAEISDSIRDFSESEGPIGRVVLITWFYCEDLLGTLMKSPTNLRVVDENHIQGAVFERDRKWQKLSLNKTELEDVLVSGYKWLFAVHSGVLVAPEGYHYEKLSTAHSTKFLRAANVFRNSNESALFALGVLEKLNLSEPPEICYTDTSAINVIGHIISDFFASSKGVTPIPVVSFGSYPGLDDGFQFDFTENSLVVMSATTTGALERKLIEKYEIPESRICTLFAANKLKGPKVLFNVSDIDEEPFGEIINYYARDCPLCAKGQPVIAITGDQFLPESAVCRPFELLKRDLSSSSSRLVNDLANGKVSCHSLGKDKNRRTFSFNLFSGQECVAEEEVKRQFGLLFGKKGIKILVPNDQVPLDWTLEPEYDISCTDDAAEVQDQPWLGIFCPVNYGSGAPASLALSLRKLDSDPPRSFLLGVSIYEDKDEREKTNSTLKFRKGGWSYLVESVYDAYLPNQRNGKTPWDFEAQWWREREYDVTCVSERLKLLTLESEVPPGEMFLPSFDGLPLEMTKGVAFFDDETRTCDQSLAYLAICLALHDRRCAKRNWTTSHNREVLDPRMFNRFTDPAIQAALLRGCLPEELNYSSDQNLSIRFAQIIDSLIAGKGIGYAAALGEFCYAVLSERVRLDGYVRGEVLKKLVEIGPFEGPWPKCFSSLAQAQLGV